MENYQKLLCTVCFLSQFVLAEANLQHFRRSTCYADVTQMLMNFNISNDCIIALLHNFMSELIFFGKNTQRNTPSKITKILGGIGVEYNYI